ncbi:MAG: hypothetical protein V8R46_01185 [Eubacterium ramulus]
MSEKVRRRRPCRRAAGCTGKSRDGWVSNIGQRFLELEVDEEHYIISLEGRADGIITTEDGVMVDEIKCMYTDVDTF